MNKRENLISLYRRAGFNEVPIGFDLCPSLFEQFKSRTGEEDVADYFGFPERVIEAPRVAEVDIEIYKAYYNFELKPNTVIDEWGVAHEPGSSSAMHMTRMRHPLVGIDSIQQIIEYPMPDYVNASTEHIAEQVKKIHSKGFAARAQMEATIWETSWYIRGMEELLMDMMTEDEKAECLLDRVTDMACAKIEAVAKAGVDIIAIGDDIGMQNSIMMSVDLYRTWIKPRLKRLINAAKTAKSDVLIKYHSCGYIIPFIEDLLEVGIDILNPVQPECMSFKGIHDQFGERLSFHGTIGTQTTMPFGKPEDVRTEVLKNLEIAGKKGGLFCAPTHLLEPEVPWENIMAYVNACKEFMR